MRSALVILDVLLPALRLCLPGHDVRLLRGHRVLAVGRSRPRVRRCAGFDLDVWPDGARPAGPLPPLTAAPPFRSAGTAAAPPRPVTLVCGPGAVAGLGRLLGARVVVPAGATGDVDSDLDAKAGAALDALDRGEDVVVHVGGPDEAAHRREPRAKRAAIEDADARIIAPLARAVDVVAVTSDHGTCPFTSRHDPGPVPVVVAGAAVASRGPGRLVEHALVAHGAAA